jgi:ATP-dependent DNA helicase RecG
MDYIESPTIELKSKYTNSYLKSVSAFATFDGGEVYFGVDEDTREVVGIDDPTETKLKIENAIHDTISPTPPYTLEMVQEDGKDIIILTVTHGKEGPYFYNGNVYHRADTSSAPLSKAEVRRLIMEFDDIDYDELPSTQSDLTFAVLGRYVKEVLGIRNTNLDILKTLGLYHRNQYNRAAQLLADENNIKASSIDIVRFGETESIFKERATISGRSLLLQYESALKMFDKWYHSYEEIVGFFREERIPIPREAYRESIANAIIHRDFLINSTIRVLMYDGRIEIISPGKLPYGVTEDNYLNGEVSVPRNSIVAEVFHRLGIIEKLATGILRIKNEYKEFVEMPTFSIKDNLIKIVLPKIRYVNNLEQHSVEESIFVLLKDNGSMSRSSLETATGLGKTRLVEVLNNLIENGKIERKGKSRGVKYGLKGER